ncbi:hypothetical protein PCIT_b0077 [Pseudoalteromonas citrea]|uniref:Uncharacterized protein n=1 Tax=Pseudoalteromonas citrea TaxID=43655 RepID=A0AAD4ADW3_9GAMM|nr:hypothetical protein PCIT_b0077 [Pseudoalteromonas citrea]
MTKTSPKKPATCWLFYTLRYAIDTSNVFALKLLSHNTPLNPA